MSDPKDIQQAGQAKIQVPQNPYPQATGRMVTFVELLTEIAELKQQNAELTRERERLKTLADTQQERLEEALAVVAKLPKCADGAPVVPGDTYFYVHPEAQQHVQPVTGLTLLMWHNVPDAIANSYSTRAAAESALASHAADQGEKDGGR